MPKNMKEKKQTNAKIVEEQIEQVLWLEIRPQGP
jgi:hypothetical protein